MLLPRPLAAGPACALTHAPPPLQIHSPMFDPEGNVFVPVTRTVKRKQRKDGSLVLPQSCFQDYWVPSYDKLRSPFPVDGEKGADGQPLTEAQLIEKYGTEGSWKDVEDSIVVRPPLVEYYKDRTSVEATLFIHRCATRHHPRPCSFRAPPPSPLPHANIAPTHPAVARRRTCATCT